MNDGIAAPGYQNIGVCQKVQNLAIILDRQRFAVAIEIDRLLQLWESGKRDGGQNQPGQSYPEVRSHRLSLLVRLDRPSPPVSTEPWSAEGPTF